MSLNIDVTVNQIPDTLPPPATFQDLLDLAAKYIVLSFEDTAIEVVFVTGTTPPDPTTTAAGTIFVQTDSAGRPISIEYVYLKQWVPFYIMPLGTLTWFIGQSSTFFDSTGKGKVGTPWFGWALANGANGTAHIMAAGRGFIVPGYRAGNDIVAVANITNPGPANSTVFRTGDATSGGILDIVILAGNLPTLGILMGVGVGRFTQNTTPVVPTGNEVPDITGAVANGDPFSGTNFPATGVFAVPTAPGLGGQQTNGMIILPPYKAAAVVQFIGY